MSYKDTRKDPGSGCACCSGSLSPAEARRIRFLAVTAIVAVLAVATAILLQVLC